MRRPFASTGWNRSTNPQALTGAALAVALLLLVTPAAGAASPGDGERHEVKERRMIVVSADGEGKLPAVLTPTLGGGYLGVELTALTPELRAHFGVPADRGVLVARVEEDSPAARAGLQVGDVITQIGGDAVEGPWDLGAAVRSHEAGEEADLVAWRDGRALDFRVALEERERRTIDVGRVLKMRLGKAPEVLEWRGNGDPPGDLPTLYFEPESVERLGEALEKLDWTHFDRPGLAERNRELEDRLQQLEERLQELEAALRRPER